MVQQFQMREAAREFVDEYADYDEEFDFHQTLVADETFGTLAHCRKELDTQLTFADGLSTLVEGHVRGGRDELETAMDERVAEVRAEVED
ncbi:hypothetical protein [Halosimplex pelagicum]|uniref:Uncharacterized protein n=1 Tax=Halosimplex pelagicum TaxID=869886 RepID=A0A7D5P756_9EURY|nr:hypothetical protein [Halosimplex pelagicum]QLH82446.1 hypothetical protein HZS54_12845 [Halosimplex pelagicum]QLH82502.1 hypothetical protein HZS54_13150 [Halosimplex pelagicum]